MNLPILYSGRMLQFWNSSFRAAYTLISITVRKVPLIDL
jgi:hypothetical protein